MKYKEGIGLYGGTFDPLHNGHVRAISKIRQLPYIVDLCIHVNYNPCYKKPMFSFDERCHFVDELNCFRIERKFSFTYQVLKYLRKLRETVPIYFFVGKEWDLKTFKNADYVIKNCIPIVIEPNEISVRSTQIREMIKRKECLNGLVPDNVKNYIEEKYYV